MVQKTAMAPDKWSLFALMLKSRLIEEVISKLWYDGLISGDRLSFKRTF